MIKVETAFLRKDEVWALWLKCGHLVMRKAHRLSEEERNDPNGCQVYGEDPNFAPPPVHVNHCPRCEGE